MVTEPDGRVTELFDLPPNEATLLRLFKLLFEKHASEIVFGPCIQGRSSRSMWISPLS